MRLEHFHANRYEKSQFSKKNNCRSFGLLSLVPPLLRHTVLFQAKQNTIFSIKIRSIILGATLRTSFFPINNIDTTQMTGIAWLFDFYDISSFLVSKKLLYLWCVLLLCAFSGLLLPKRILEISNVQRKVERRVGGVLWCDIKAWITKSGDLHFVSFTR